MDGISVEIQRRRDQICTSPSDQVMATVNLESKEPELVELVDNGRANLNGK